MQSKFRFISKDASPVLLGIIVVIFLAGGITIAIFALRSDPVSEILSNDQVISILYIIEKDQKPLSSYVLMCYPKTKKAAIYDIPEELGMFIKSINRYDRFDTVYDPNNVSNYEYEISSLLGVDINFTIVINTENLAKAVDLIEGVELFIPSKVSFNDNNGLVLFPSGINRLDGDKALSYISYKTPDEDRETVIFRRQRFFMGFLKRQAEMNETLKISSVSQMYQSFLQTNLSQRSRVRLFDILSEINIDRINIQTVGGNMQTASGKTILIPYHFGDLVKDIVLQVLITLVDTEESSMSVRVFTVEVLNGTTRNRLAGRTAEVLRGFGYDVISISNADNSNYEKTLVIDRCGLDGAAKKFADIIRCTNIRNEYTSNENNDSSIQNYEYKSDFTLILGWDYNDNGRYVTSN